jgi:hypothetical protein
MAFLDITLDGSDTGRINKQKRGYKVDATQAVKFLDRNSTAKIVVIVDTHCMQDSGLFVWGGKRGEASLACHLITVCVMSLRTIDLPHTSTAPQGLHPGGGI